MSSRHVTVETGCRLHFGLLAFGRSEGRNFGGVGVMLEQPSLRIRLRPANQFTVSGPESSRVAQAADGFAKLHQLPAPPACAIGIEQALPPHAGLGSGTQTALATIAGLRSFFHWPELEAGDLAREADRARRSSIGTYGFLQGGLIYEQGQARNEAIGPLAARVQMPTSWRVVLIIPQHEPWGIHGATEQSAFARLSPVSLQRERQLIELIESRMLPAARGANFQQFSEAVHDYGHEAGMSFAEIQNGPFASPEVAARVDWLRAHGIAGVGQTSWGPAVFAWAASEEAAQAIVKQLATAAPFAGCRTLVCPVANRGATICN